MHAECAKLNAIAQDAAPPKTWEEWARREVRRFSQILNPETRLR